ncbi:diversity-generating retroelement protein Avd [bacterium]|jgi:hypothetical protein|nr:diversity-generating retroelement protein Avd [bacterium]MBT5988574.1 diversity-generating retroelement protein Avd [bacterium]
MVHLNHKLDIPIFAKTYELYKLFYRYQKNIPKTDRYTLWQKNLNILLATLEIFFLVAHLPKEEKNINLKKASVNLDLLRVFIRLAYETKALDLKKYVQLQESIDEIGRMLGGWLKTF